jgi:hypothetical protein
MAYLGGSAFAMAKDVGDGFILLNTSVLKRMTADELRQLRFEIQRIQMGIRSEQHPIDNSLAIQARNRKLSRLNSAVMMIDNQIQGNR